MTNSHKPIARKNDLVVQEMPGEVLVYDLKTRELLYYDHVNMGMKIKEKDFDKLNKAAGL